MYSHNTNTATNTQKTKVMARSVLVLLVLVALFSLSMAQQQQQGSTTSATTAQTNPPNVKPATFEEEITIEKEGEEAIVQEPAIINQQHKEEQKIDNVKSKVNNRREHRENNQRRERQLTREPSLWDDLFNWRSHRDNMMRRRHDMIQRLDGFFNRDIDDDFFNLQRSLFRWPQVLSRRKLLNDHWFPDTQLDDDWFNFPQWRRVFRRQTPEQVQQVQQAQQQEQQEQVQEQQSQQVQQQPVLPKRICSMLSEKNDRFEIELSNLPEQVEKKDIAMNVKLDGHRVILDISAKKEFDSRDSAKTTTEITGGADNDTATTTTTTSILFEKRYILSNADNRINVNEIEAKFDPESHQLSIQVMKQPAQQPITKQITIN